MCEHDKPSNSRVRFGACLEHGRAHSEDHFRWSRRDFLSSMGLAAAGGAFALAGTPVRVFGHTPLLAHLRRLETDRVLVLVQLSGGNDGLNTVVPITDDLYYNARPQISVPATQAVTIPGQSDLGLHPSFSPLTPLYGDGNMAVLQNVGYPDPRLSHFESTDIWLASSGTGEAATSGWVGRYLESEYPDFTDDPPDFPLAVQMGGTSALLFQGSEVNMGMSLASPEIFQRIAEQGILYTLEGLPETTYGEEMAFVRTVANDSFKYAENVQEASEQGINRVEYPQNNPLAQNLAIVARLIKGRLGARIYHVSIGSFDTHAGQGGVNGQHATLLQRLADAIVLFLQDLAADEADREVLVATFSEFGRRVDQNGSGGTDHGTGAPLFLFGNKVDGGLYGESPDLADLDQTGNVRFGIDFRSVYATLLENWFGLTPEVTAAILGDSYEILDFVESGMPVASEPDTVPSSFALHQNYPNPFNPSTNITYTLDRPDHVSLRIFDQNGRLVQTLIDGRQTSGSYNLRFDAGHLASGMYLYRLETSAGSRTRRMSLVR